MIRRTDGHISRVLGWRKIQGSAADGVTKMLALFAQAVAKGKKVTIYADGDFVYQAYLL